MQAHVTILGSGTSHGVPVIGCGCAVCQSADPRDTRTRPSIFVDVDDGPKILVDTSTDLRQQALAHGVTRVDAILFTHGHADHVMGLDDSRPFSHARKNRIPCYADAGTCDALRRTFSYIFDHRATQGGGLPQIELTTITGPFNIGQVGIRPVPLLHGALPVLGFRLGNFAYLTDCNHVPDASWALLDGLDILILDALRHRPHPTHFSVSEALTVVDRVKPQRTYLTHICHDLPHAATNAALPPSVELAYDGLRLTIEAEASWT